MKKSLAMLAASVFFVSAFLATAAKQASAALLSFDGKVDKISVSYMVYNNGSQRFVTKNISFHDPSGNVSPNANFTLDEAPPFNAIDGQMLVEAGALIVYNGTLLEVSKGLLGNVTCSGRIILSGDVTFNGTDYLGTGEVLEFEGANVVNIVGKENSNGQIVGMARMVIVAFDAEVVDVAGDVITGRTPTKADIKITPMRIQQSIL